MDTLLQRLGTYRWLLTGLGGLLLLWLAWLWFFCRFYVPAGYMAIVIAKTGTPLPPGQILAQPGQQGIQEAVLGEGRHFLDPIFYRYELAPLLTIGPGKVGVVTAKVGTDLPSGEFLAAPGQKGIWREVLGPGSYRLNPYGYQVEVTNAVSIPIGYVGVLTSLAGVQAPAGEFAKPGQKGVRKDILQPGLYYLNPKAYQCDVLEVGVNQISLLGSKGAQVITKTQIVTQNAAMDELQKQVLNEQTERRNSYLAQRALNSSVSAQRNVEQELVAAAPAVMPEADRDDWGRSSAKDAPKKERKREEPRRQLAEGRLADKPAPALNLNQLVEFPSRDGFEISLDMSVEFELLPERIAALYQNYGDLPAVVDNIILPQILSVSRLKGSAYRANDFIIGEGREKFQADMTEALRHILADKAIVVHNALIRHVNVPMQILEPIQQASVAVEIDLTNKEKQNTAKKLALLNSELGLIARQREQVGQETEKLKAEINADQERQVAALAANAARQVAEVAQKTAQLHAQKTQILGAAQAKASTLVEGERARNLARQVQAFGGDPVSLTQWQFAQALNPQVRVNLFHAGAGTLWTDLNQARSGQLLGPALWEAAQQPAASTPAGTAPPAAEAAK